MFPISLIPRPMTAKSGTQVAKSNRVHVSDEDEVKSDVLAPSTPALIASAPMRFAAICGHESSTPILPTAAAVPVDAM